MLLKERNGTAQNRVVQIVTQVGNHAESRVVDQVGPAVVENTFQYSGRDQGERHDSPGIMQMRGNNLLQADMETGTEERDGSIGRVGIQYPVEDGANQQETKGLQKANRGHQHD